MRFNNGSWLLREGVKRFLPAEVHEVRVGEHEVKLLAPSHPVNDIGDAIDCVSFSITITAPAPEVIRVQVRHHAGVLHHGPDFELDLPEPAPIDVDDTDETLTVRSGHLSLVIDKRHWSMTYLRDGEPLTTSGTYDLALLKNDWKGLPYDRGPSYLRQHLTLGVGELVYGLGERFGPLVRNGQSIEMWNEDGGTGSDQAYKNVPLYVTTKGYGVFVNSPGRVDFEVGAESVGKVGFSVQSEDLDYFLFDGPTMKEAIARYASITGKPALPPEWSFGLWLSTSFVTRYDEETILGLIDGMAEREIPLSVFHFDAGWMREFHWTDLLWDDRKFPDPASMLRKIHERDIKVCVWMNPYIALESALFEEGMAGGYLLKRPDGSVWQWDMWQPGLAIVDFTNPAAREWFQGKLKALLDTGVDCLKTDFGERIPTDVAWFDGSDPERMHNYYGYLYQKCVFELLERAKGPGEAVLFARAGTTGCQRFPVHWGGDCTGSYESMAESLRGGLSLMASGFGFWSHDIGGFEDAATPDLYKRWVAFGLLSTHSRLHGSRQYKVPWVYDDEAVDVLRRFADLKLELMPYLWDCARETAGTGVPMMRPMVLEFPEDENCRYLDRQYLLGGDLLVAPIFNPEGVARYYLPELEEGVWTNYLTGEEDPGGHWRTERLDYLTIPLWVRGNSKILGLRA